MGDSEAQGSRTQSSQADTSPDKPTLHDVVSSTPAGQQAAQQALDDSMAVQRASRQGADELDKILRGIIDERQYIDGDTSYMTDAEFAESKAKLESYIRTHQLDLVDQFRDRIEGAYAAVEMAMGEAYYQITQADKKGDNDGKMATRQNAVS